MRSIFTVIILVSFALALGACTSPERQNTPTGNSGLPFGGISDPEVPPVHRGKTLPIIVFDAHFNSLDDPVMIRSLERADLFITDPSQYWGRPDLVENLNTVRAINPNLKVIGFFRSKCVRTDWANLSELDNSYNYDLYQTARPYFSYTTEGDTLSDWPGVAIYNFLDPEVRHLMLAVFLKYQLLSGAPLDGMFWDYFNNSLWISPNVDNVIGDPDMDGDGIVHWSDPDELEAFQTAAEDWSLEVRSALGDDFIQIFNGSRALSDSTFAGLADGLFYETFPYVGFNSERDYGEALDAQTFNNLWAAKNWPRQTNGGPWLILSNIRTNIRFTDVNSDLRTLNLGDLNRAVALLTDAAFVYYDMAGGRHAGLPSVELALGLPTDPVKIVGNVFSREFENGYIELVMGTGASPIPFTFEIHQNGELVQIFDFPIYFP